MLPDWGFPCLPVEFASCLKLESEGEGSGIKKFRNVDLRSRGLPAVVEKGPGANKARLVVSSRHAARMPKFAVRPISIFLARPYSCRLINILSSSTLNFRCLVCHLPCNPPGNILFSSRERSCRKFERCMKMCLQTWRHLLS